MFCNVLHFLKALAKTLVVLNKEKSAIVNKVYSIHNTLQSIGGLANNLLIVNLALHFKGATYIYFGRS